MVGFYEYYEGLQEGWDGPALLVFSDGSHVGARLDRNGLRPARFWVTSDDIVYVASEVCFLLIPITTYLLDPSSACCLHTLACSMPTATLLSQRLLLLCCTCHCMSLPPDAQL